MQPRLTESLPFVGNPNFVIDLLDAAPSSLAVLLLSTSAAPTKLARGCELLPSLAGTLLPLGTNAAGFASLHLPIAERVGLHGLRLLAQAVVLDPRAPNGLALSNARGYVIGD